MTPRVRMAVATVVGLAIGIAVIVLIETINATFFPLPPGLSLDDPQAMGQAVADARGVLIGVLVAWLLGTLSGAWSATIISKSPSRLPGGVVTVFFLIGALLNLMAFPHPVWFWVMGLGAVAVGGHLGWMFGTPDMNPASPRRERE